MSSYRKGECIPPPDECAMIIAAQQVSGPASAPTLPDLGPNNPHQENAVNKQHRTPAPGATPDDAAIHDPLMEAITAYKAERDAAYAIPLEDQKDAAFDEAYNGRVLPLFFKIKDIAPTTMAGVLLALQFLKEENEAGPSVLSESLINGVTTFLERRAA